MASQCHISALSTAGLLHTRLIHVVDIRRLRRVKHFHRLSTADVKAGSHSSSPALSLNWVLIADLQVWPHTSCCHTWRVHVLHLSCDEQAQYIGQSQIVSAHGLCLICLDGPRSASAEEDVISLHMGQGSCW